MWRLFDKMPLRLYVLDLYSISIVIFS